MCEKHETGLALSGGGFRATLFHLGAIWRFNEMAMLPEIGRVSSVSGGSILAGLMTVQWPRLDFRDGVAVNFTDEIFGPIWRFCSRNVDRAAVCPASTIFAGWRQSVLPVHLLGLAPLLGSIGPVAGDVKLQDDGVVHDPVNRRGGGHGVGEDALPLREDQV